MILVLWMFLAVPKQSCLDAYDARKNEPGRRSILSFRPYVRQYAFVSPPGPTPSNTEDTMDRDCYDVFAASTTFNGTVWPKAVEAK